MDSSIGQWLETAAHLIGARVAALLEADGRDETAMLGPFVPRAHVAALAARHGQAVPERVDLHEINRQLSDPALLAALPVGRLMRAFALPHATAPLLALMLLPEWAPAFSTMFAYLHDDPQRRRLTPALAARLIGPPPLPWSILLAPDGALRAGAMIEVEADPGRPLPDRGMRWGDHLAAYLMGDLARDARDPALRGHLRQPPVLPPALLTAAAPAAPRFSVIGPVGSGRAATAVALLRARGRDAITVHLPDNLAQEETATLLRIAMREAALGPGALIVSGAEILAEATMRSLVPPPGLELVFVAATRLPVPMPIITVPALDVARARILWRDRLGTARADDADRLAQRFRLPLDDLARVASEAPVDAGFDELARRCVDQSSTTLAELAVPVDIRHGWDDLVLNQRQLDGLREIVLRGTHARTVYDDWGMAQKLAPARGLVALFSGPSGAGKTLSAGIVAQAIGLPLYRVDLSTTVSKYIGETEKNLERIFRAAEAGNACLLFDECDALFGKRSDVSDAHDRYANIETSYLLQRIEVHRGIVFLASNFPQNIDDAFSRRIDITIDFTLPDAAMRAKLWTVLMPPEAGAEIDSAALGAQFELSGGAIRNCIVTAAFLAASETTTIQTKHCVRAVAQEYAKTGRTLTRKEFGDSFGLLRQRPER